MYFSFYFLFICSLVHSSFCHHLDNCYISGIDPQRCDFDDGECIVRLTRAAYPWFESEEAKSFLVEGLNPLRVDELSGYCGVKKITLQNVSISGLTESRYTINYVSELYSPPGGKFDSEFVIDLTLDADDSSVLYLDTDEEKPNQGPVSLSYSGVYVKLSNERRKVYRCDGEYHLRIINTQFETVSPKGTCVRGSDIFGDDCAKILINEAAKKSILTLYSNANALQQVLNYETFFKS